MWTTRGLQVVVGAAFLIATVFAGFDSSGRYKESIIGSIVDINKVVVASPSYVFERWLVIAVALTTILNIVFYGTHLWDALSIIKDPEVTSVPGLAKLAIILLPGASLGIGVIIPWYYLVNYLHSPNSIANLEMATVILVALFVGYDIINWIIGSVLTGQRAHRTKQEAQRLFFRVDLPILISYVVLIIFTMYSVDVTSLSKIYEGWAHSNAILPANLSSHATFAFNSFTAGAAAFKLVISNLLFTIFMGETLISEKLSNK